MTRSLRDPYEGPGGWERWIERRVDALGARGATTLEPGIPNFMFPNPTGGDTISVYLDVSTTRADWHDVHGCRMERVVRPAIFCYLSAYAPVGSTGEMRMRLSSAGGGTFTSAAVTISSGGYRLKIQRWVHTHRLWLDQGVDFSIQARLTSGAGPITVYPTFNGVEQVPDTTGDQTGDLSIL